MAIINMAEPGVNAAAANMARAMANVPYAVPR